MHGVLSTMMVTHDVVVMLEEMARARARARGDDKGKGKGTSVIQA